MIIKVNASKVKGSNVMGMGVDQKVGIFFSKQQRTKELQQQNLQLQQRLNMTLQKFQKQHQNLSRLQAKNKTSENLLSALTTQNQLLTRQNKKNQQSLSLLQFSKQTLTSKEKQLTAVMIDIQKQLFDATSKYQEQSNLLQRYQEEIKNQKSLRFAPDSIVNIVAKLQKDLELLKRNIAIHQNKLEGKKKYLTLLEKKTLNEIGKKKKITQELNPTKTPLNIYDKNSTINHLNQFGCTKQQLKTKEVKGENQNQNQKKIEKQDKKQDAKKLNQMIRKKNALMAENKTKKKI